ncbi:cytosine methyltransferase [Pokkaliibacter plantistimulans]|uniref:Cytosine-specific methyltransferase n=1 Tax=Proteobacteria bacterium 228 TaxID=2083153 RepID=A0A2S5KST3_9PROT|nr:DNA cytosine methyltransferase [Pokkaliibacter plantistimulans]PPC77911.1 cytosine methyltransferase [Pokkaliibacter plantistimulans]
MRFNAIDLFAGGGGLSEGLRQAGFNIVAAVENNPFAVDTFKANHKDAYIFDGDIRYVSVTDVFAKSKMSKGELSLLAACPPCQGFSSLTSKYKREDERNTLILEVSRLIKGLMPKTVMIENVPGLMGKGKEYLTSFVNELESLGYIVNYDVLQVADYGVPQDRKRFVLLAGLGFEIKIPEPTHSQSGEDGKLKWKTVGEAISDLSPPVSLKRSFQYGGPRKFGWNIIRDMTGPNLERLRHSRPGGNRSDIPVHLRPKCHQGSDKGFGNVYGRMSFDQASPTITGGCTVLSKGRFGHPSELRTISVREAARLQTFPDSYEFASDYMDKVCQIIGNALPCDFARQMSKACQLALVEAMEKKGNQ